MASKRERSEHVPMGTVRKAGKQEALTAPKKYTKKPARGVSHGWTVFTPEGEALCYIGDAAVADNVLDHLNRDAP